MDLVLDAVETGHEHGREGQIRIGGGVREAHLHALRFRAWPQRDAAAGRTVAGGIGQQHRRLVARHQPLVGVGGRVGEGVHCLGVLQDSADVKQGDIRQVSIFVAGEDRLIALPDRLVDMHTGAVVAEHRLRHEGCRLAVGLGHVVDHIFVDLQSIAGLHQRAELDAQLVLGGAHLMVMLLGDDAHVGHHTQHFRAQVLRGVDRRHREIAALGAGAVTEIAHLVFRAHVRRQLGGVDPESAIIGVNRKAHVVEHEELRLGPEHGLVADPRLLQIGLGLSSDGAGIALIRLVGQRLKHVAENRQRALGEERINRRRVRVGHQLHVRLVDHLPAGDGRPVEHDAVGEGLLIHHLRIHGNVLHLAARIGEAEIDELDVLVLDLLGQALSVCHGTPLSLRMFDAPLRLGRALGGGKLLAARLAAVLVKWRRSPSLPSGCAPLLPHWR